MKYIFLDIDGTLFDHETLCIPESTHRAIELARRKGNKIFISTGRCSCMLDIIEDIRPEGVIAAAGAYVEVGGNIIYEENLTNADVKEVTNLCDRYNIAYILEGKRAVYMDSRVVDYFHADGKIEDSVKEFFSQGIFCGLSDRKEEEVIYKMCLYALTEEDLSGLREALPEKYHITFGQGRGDGPYSAELTLLKNNKASGIRKVLQYCGADMADTVAIGDSLNDLEMIKECTVGIAMGNADERLKPHADFITDDIGKHGIYKAFERFQLI